MEDDAAKDAPRSLPPPPIFKAPRQISRPKAPAQQEEELGAEPKLGDFEDVHALSISEARAVIQAVHRARAAKPQDNPLGEGRIHNDSQTIQQFVEYLEQFSHYKENDNLHSLSGLLDSYQEFTSVDKAMLSSLACESADEAKTLIPSLANKLGDDALQSVLDEMQKLQHR